MPEVHPIIGIVPDACLVPLRQIGIENFEPMRPYFLDLHTASMAYLPNLPGLGALEVPVDKSRGDDDSQDQLPVLVCN